MSTDRPLIHVVMGLAIAVALFAAVLIDSTDLRVALFGLIGTLTGALATFEATQVATRRERRAMSRAAGRLLQEDLIFARTRCMNAQRNGRFWSPRLDLRLDGWERYREVVARELDERADWQSIVSAFEAMRAAQSKCTSLRPDFGDRPGFGTRSREVVAIYLERSNRAITTLERLSGDRPADEPVNDDEAP
jgi:hypothetical protein